MAGKRKWFLLGLLGTLAGVAMRLVRGRREGQTDIARWEPPKD